MLYLAMRPVLIFLLSHFFLASVSQPYNYYFGNLHAHTGLSDGSKDSLSSGVSKPDGAYTYAKLSQDFDFLGISEHNHYSNNNNPGFTLPSYQLGLNMAGAANQDGNFVALFGMEYGVSSNFNGHVVIYGFNQLIGWEPGNYNLYNGKSDYDSLFRKVKNNPNAFCYLAHPGFSDYTTSGLVSTALAYAPYNPAYDSAIVGMPLRSGLAFSTADDYNDYSQGNYFAYYRQLLAVGYHLGIGYDHDNHYTNFGRSNGGRLVVLAPSLTKNNLMAAMQRMHFYGSDDGNARVEFKLDTAMMGSVLTGSTYPVLYVTHTDPDGEQADSIKIWKGINDHSGSLANVVYNSLSNNTAVYSDDALQVGKEYYYFAEIRQADGQWIVTSPIWYKPLALLALKENKPGFELNCFLNPVYRQLDISLSGVDDYYVSLTDAEGKILVEKQVHGIGITLDLVEYTAGVYTLCIRSGKGMVVKKLVLY